MAHDSRADNYTPDDWQYWGDLSDGIAVLKEHKRLTKKAADRIEALEAQAVPPGYIKIPTSRDEAEKMILLAQNYLEFNK